MSVIDASSNKGIDGQVIVDSPANDVAGAVAVLPTAFLKEFNLAADSCAARTIANSSSLVLEEVSEPLPGEELLLASGGQPRASLDHHPKNNNSNQ